MPMIFPNLMLLLLIPATLILMVQPARRQIHGESLLPSPLQHQPLFYGVERNADWRARPWLALSSRRPFSYSIRVSRYKIWYGAST